MGQTNQPDDLISRIKRLEQQVKELRRPSTLGNAALSQGSFEVRDDGGNTVLRAGKFLSGADEVYGLAAWRDNGSIQFLVWDNGSGDGYWSLWDEVGNIVVSNDTDSGQGLATPYIPYRPMPYSEVLTPPQSTTSGTFGALHRVHGQKQHPIIRAHLILQADASTTGEVRLAVDGSAISDVQVIDAGENVYRTIDCALAGGHLSFQYVDVEARRVSGAGAIRVGVAFVEGKQS